MTMRALTLAALAAFVVSGCERQQPAPASDDAKADSAAKPDATAAQAPAGEVAIARSPDGHFRVRGRVNDNDVQFLVDTGATVVALTQDDADRSGLYRLNDAYTEQVQTASGMTEAAPVVIARLELGDIVLEDVRAVIVRDYPGPSLLGQSFLSRLQDVSIRQDVMTLR